MAEISVTDQIKGTEPNMTDRIKEMEPNITDQVKGTKPNMTAQIKGTIAASISEMNSELPGGMASPGHATLRGDANGRPYLGATRMEGH